MSWPADTLLCQRMGQSSVVDAGQVAMQMQMVDVPAPLSESDWIEQKNGNWRNICFTARSETNEERRNLINSGA